MDYSRGDRDDTSHDPPLAQRTKKDMLRHDDKMSVPLTWESYADADEDESMRGALDELSTSVHEERSNGSEPSELGEYVVHGQVDLEYDEEEIVKESQRIIDISSFPRNKDPSESDDDSEADMVFTFEEVDEVNQSSENHSASKSKDGGPISMFTGTDEQPQPGRPASNGMTFCPIVPISKFPYKFVPPEYAEEVAGTLFNGGKFWDRSFDLFYLWPITDIIPKPIIFIPSTQFDEIIFDINTSFPNLELDCRNSHYRELGLLLTFPDHPRLAPRFLGFSSNRDEYQRLISFVPPPDYQPPGETLCLKPDDRSLAEYQAKIETVKLINVNRAKDRKVKKLQEKLRTNQKLGKQLSRAQRYLGLHGGDDNDLHLSTTLNINDPPPFPFEDDLVLIAIDCEAYEEGSRPITEVGIVSVDTRDLGKVAPGDKAGEWFEHIYCRHIRIQEHAHLVNHKFVKGCPENFEFGESEFVAERDAPRYIASCFRPPFGKVPQAGYTGASLTGSDTASGASEIAEETQDEEEKEEEGQEAPREEKRNILLIGHDTMQDVHYLQKLGYNPQNLPNLREIADTAHMWRTYRQDTQTTSLSNLLLQLGLAGWNLHNAGNDAAYTMQCFLTMCVKAASEGPEDQEERQARHDAELQEKIESLKEEHALEQSQWADANSDAGEDNSNDLRALDRMKLTDEADPISSDHLGQNKKYRFEGSSERKAILKALRRPVEKGKIGADVSISTALNVIEPEDDVEISTGSIDVPIILDTRSEDENGRADEDEQAITDKTWTSDDEAEMSKGEFAALQAKLNSIWKPIREGREAASGKTAVD